MFDPYYAPNSGALLSKPLVLMGFWGSRVAEIAYSLTQMSGIPFVDIERKMEHHTGMRLQRFLWKNDPQRVSKIEKKILERSLSTMNTPPIIALRPESFLQEDIRKMLQSSCDTYYIKKNVFLLFSQILSVLDRNERTRYFSLPVSDSRDINQVAKCLREYEQYYNLATHTLHVEKEHPLKTANQLLSDIQKG